MAHPNRRFWRSLQSSVLCLVLATATSVAVAAPVSITPTAVTLGNGHATALISVTNEGDVPARFEVSLNTWVESPEGETQLTPTEEVMVFPQAILLAPHETKKVRIGTEVPPGPSERSYRLVLQEMPQINRDTNKFDIQVLSKISLPVFVGGPNIQPKPLIASPIFQDGVLSFDVANTGTSHFMLKQVTVSGRVAGNETFSLSANGWYVLAGGRRTYKLSLAASDCRSATELLIKTKGDAEAIETHIPVNVSACGSAGESKFLKTGAPL